MRLLIILCCMLLAESFRSLPISRHGLRISKPRSMPDVHRMHLPRDPSTSLTQQHMFGRFFRLISSNFNALIRRFEDPEKMIEQAVLDMQNDLVRIRQSYAEVSATQKRMQRQKEEADTDSVEWYRRAQLALQKGDEELAREALNRRATRQATASSLDKQITLQADAISKLYSSMQMLEAKIVEAKGQKEGFIARARTAKTSLKVTDMLSSLDTSSSMEAFERMKEKVLSLETQAEVSGEMAACVGSGKLETRFASLGASSVDEELNKMRSSLPQRHLPSASAVQEGEDYEKLKQQMRLIPAIPTRSRD